MGHDPRQVRQRLHVVDDGRLPVEPHRRREERRLQAGHAAVALEALDERRLLAHDVGAGAGVQHDVGAEVAAADLRAHVPRCVGLVERRGEALGRQRHLAAHVQEALRETQRVAGDEASLDELVRVALHQQAVLVGAGLALVAVHHQVARPDVRRAEAPLHPRREAGAAASQQAGRLDLGVHRGRRRGQRPAQALVAAGVEVAPEGVAVGEVPPGGHDHPGGVGGRHLRQRARAVALGGGLVALPPGRRPAGGRRRGPGGALGRDLLAHRGQRAVGRHVGAVAVAQLADQPVEVLGRHAAHVAVVHLQAGRLGAGRHAFHRLQGDLPVGGGAAHGHAQRLAGVFDQLVGAEQVAADAPADVQAVGAAGRALEHLVERAGAEDLRGRGAHQFGDVLHRLGADVAVLGLGHVQQRDEGRARHGVAPHDLGGQLDVLVAETSHQRSTSPMVRWSTEEMIVAARPVVPPRPAISGPPRRWCGGRPRR